MSEIEVIERETPDRKEQVKVSKQEGYVRRERIIEDIRAAREQTLYRITQILWFMFGVIETLIGLRILLKLIAANPNNPFASMLYSLTDLFLFPFFGLTPTPASGGMVLEISSIIAMIVYALLFWGMDRVIRLFFNARPRASFQLTSMKGTRSLMT